MTASAVFTQVLAIIFLAGAHAIVCEEGSYYWVRDGIERCRICPPGCACPGGYTACYGCSGGFFSGGSGSPNCTACPMGTTSDIINNAGCDPDNYETPCANAAGPLGQIACRPDPPPAALQFAAPCGALYFPPQYIDDGGVDVPNKVSPYYDMYGRPMNQQSY